MSLSLVYRHQLLSLSSHARLSPRQNQTPLFLLLLVHKLLLLQVLPMGKRWGHHHARRHRAPAPNTAIDQPTPIHKDRTRDPPDSSYPTACRPRHTGHAPAAQIRFAPAAGEAGATRRAGGVCGMVHKLVEVPEEDVFGDVEGEVRQKQKLDLQRVDLLAGHAPDLGVVQVVEVLVVEKLGREHDRGDQDPVHVQRGQGKVALLDQPVDVNERQHQTLRGARCVLVDPFQVLSDTNTRGARRVEFGDSGRVPVTLSRLSPLVHIQQLLKHASQGADQQPAPFFRTFVHDRLPPPARPRDRCGGRQA
jgi:hypothetical protein